MRKVHTFNCRRLFACCRPVPPSLIHRTSKHHAAARLAHACLPQPGCDGDGVAAAAATAAACGSKTQHIMHFKLTPPELIRWAWLCVGCVHIDIYVYDTVEQLFVCCVCVCLAWRGASRSRTGAFIHIRPYLRAACVRLHLQQIN